MTENERFWACFRENWVYKFGHRFQLWNDRLDNFKADYRLMSPLLRWAGG
jgi:hypothetical protein